MKILVVGDIHWSAYSSILRSRGKRFSTRLEYLIKSMNWVEDMSKKYGVEMLRWEGKQDGKWVVADYGDVIVHIFYEETRIAEQDTLS